MDGGDSDQEMQFKSYLSRHKAAFYTLGLVSTFVILAFFALCKSSETIWHMATGNTDVVVPDHKALNKGVRIYDGEDRLICILKEGQDRTAVPLSKVSPAMKKAIVAAEDRRFYNHSGIDPVGIVRAAVTNSKEGEIVEGASTITQQLIRNLYLNPRDQSYKRKFIEALGAVSAESKYGKEEILESYLNVVYFGSGKYGVEDAARYYFDKRAQNLNYAESAYLAGLVKAPSVYGSEKHFKQAQERKNLVLNLLAETGAISSKDLLKARKYKLKLVRKDEKLALGHYVSKVRERLEQELGDELWKGEWQVYTYMNPEAQKLAQAAVSKGIEKAPSGVNQGALVSIDQHTGGVIAMVGGKGDFEESPWNRADHPHTAGSIIKPFVYLAALQNGVVKVDSMINDEEMIIKQGESDSSAYKPVNYDHHYRGWMTVRKALVTSRNTCSVRVAQSVGIPHVVNTARLAGLKSPMEICPALALGCCALTPVEAATAFSTIARGGVRLEPQFLRRIETRDGEVVREFNPTPYQCLPEKQCLQILDVLKDVVAYGTGAGARLSKIEVAGKTGTADDSKDLWFVGMTPEVTTSVWAGNDENDRVKSRSATGGRVCARIWRDFNAGYIKTVNKPEKTRFEEPDVKLIVKAPEIDPSYFAYFPGYDSSSMLSRLQYETSAGIAPASRIALVKALEDRVEYQFELESEFNEGSKRTLEQDKEQETLRVSYVERQRRAEPVYRETQLNYLGN